MASFLVRGVISAQDRVSSICRTTFPSMRTDGCMSLTAKITAFRCSARTGGSEAEWKNLHRPCALCTQSKSKPFSFVGELGPGLAVNREYPNLGPRLSIMDHGGALVARLGTSSFGVEPGSFMAPHGIATNSQGNIYIAEVGSVGFRQRYPGQDVPNYLPNLKKLVLVRQP